MSSTKAAHAAPDSGGRTPKSAGPASADLLDYMADMIGELKGMSEARGCATLSGLLGLAEKEAQLRRDEVRRSMSRGRRDQPDFSETS